MRCWTRRARVLGSALSIAIGTAVPTWAAQGITERVSVGPDGVQSNGESFGRPAISAGGRFVAFKSYASNLVSGDTNSVLDVFVRDRQTGTIQRVSVGPGGVQSNGGSFGDPSMSADGRSDRLPSRNQRESRPRKLLFARRRLRARSWRRACHLLLSTIACARCGLLPLHTKAVGTGWERLSECGRRCRLRRWYRPGRGW